MKQNYSKNNVIDEFIKDGFINLCDDAQINIQKINESIKATYDNVKKMYANLSSFLELLNYGSSLDYIKLFYEKNDFNSESGDFIDRMYLG